MTETAIYELRKSIARSVQDHTDTVTVSMETADQLESELSWLRSAAKTALRHLEAKTTFQYFALSSLRRALKEDDADAPDL